MARCMSTLMRITRFSRNKRHGLLRAACFSDWLFHLHVPQHHGWQACSHSVLLHIAHTQSFRFSHLEHASITLHAWCACAFEGKEHAWFGDCLDDAWGNFENIRSRQIDRIYFSRWIFANSFAVRAIMVWFMYGCPRSCQFSSAARILSVLERNKKNN